MCRVLKRKKTKSNKAHLLLLRQKHTQYIESVLVLVQINTCACFSFVQLHLYISFQCVYVCTVTEKPEKRKSTIERRGWLENCERAIHKHTKQFKFMLTRLYFLPKKRWPSALYVQYSTTAYVYFRENYNIFIEQIHFINYQYVIWWWAIIFITTSVQLIYTS